MLEVSHDDDFAVGFVQLIQCQHEPFFHFLPQGRCRRRQFRIPQQRGEVGGRLIVGRETADVLLAIDRTSLGRPMPTMHVDDAVFRQLTQPQMKRHGWAADIVRQSLRRFQQHILHDITRIDAPRHSLIQTHLHHPPHSFAMPIHQPIHGRRVTVGHTL